nr:DNA-binding protein [Desulfobacterales bacterium]
MEKNRIPIKEGLWTTPASGEEPQLIGSKCKACGELFFPRKEKGWCIHCQQETLEDVRLSRRGKIVSFSVVMQQPGGDFYKGPVPYAYGCVDLPDGIRIESLFTTDDFNELKVGRDVELRIEKLYEDDEGNEVLTFKFTPI